MITREEYSILEQCVRFSLVAGGADKVLENAAHVLPVLAKIRACVRDCGEPEKTESAT